MSCGCGSTECTCNKRCVCYTSRKTNSCYCEPCIVIRQIEFEELSQDLETSISQIAEKPVSSQDLQITSQILEREPTSIEVTHSTTSGESIKFPDASQNLETKELSPSKLTDDSSRGESIKCQNDSNNLAIHEALNKISTSYSQTIEKERSETEKRLSVVRLRETSLVIEQPMLQRHEKENSESEYLQAESKPECSFGSSQNSFIDPRYIKPDCSLKESQSEEVPASSSSSNSTVSKFKIRRFPNRQKRLHGLTTSTSDNTSDNASQKISSSDISCSSDKNNTKKTTIRIERSVPVAARSICPTCFGNHPQTSMFVVPSINDNRIHRMCQCTFPPPPPSTVPAPFYTTLPPMIRFGTNVLFPTVTASQDYILRTQPTNVIDQPSTAVLPFYGNTNALQVILQALQAPTANSDILVAGQSYNYVSTLPTIASNPQLSVFNQLYSDIITQSSLPTGIQLPIAPRPCYDIAHHVTTAATSTVPPQHFYSSTAPVVPITEFYDPRTNLRSFRPALPSSLPLPRVGVRPSIATWLNTMGEETPRLYTVIDQVNASPSSENIHIQENTSLNNENQLLESVQQEILTASTDIELDKIVEGIHRTEDDKSETSLQETAEDEVYPESQYSSADTDSSDHSSKN